MSFLFNIFSSLSHSTGEDFSERQDFPKNSSLTSSYAFLLSFEKYS